MPTNYIVSRGECLSSIAKNFGISDWRTIYNHAENAAFRQKRPNPNIICAGDELYVPDPEVGEESRGTDSLHSFKKNAHKTTLHLIVQDEMGRPLKSKPYDLVVGDKAYQGTTGADGSIDREISDDEPTAELTVHASGGGYSWSLTLGTLDPHDTDSGVKQRLSNLGFDVDPESDEWDDAAVTALKAFQYAMDLPVTGEVDDTTRNKLLSLHDQA